MDSGRNLPHQACALIISVDVTINAFNDIIVWVIVSCTSLAESVV